MYGFCDIEASHHVIERYNFDRGTWPIFTRLIQPVLLEIISHVLNILQPNLSLLIIAISLDLTTNNINDIKVISAVQNIQSVVK